MDKFTIFRELLDYVAHIATVTDADMNYYKDTMRITGENDCQYIEIQVSISKKKEDEKDGN